MKNKIVLMCSEPLFRIVLSPVSSCLGNIYKLCNNFLK